MRIYINVRTKISNYRGKQFQQTNQKNHNNKLKGAESHVTVALCRGWRHGRKFISSPELAGTVCTSCGAHTPYPSLRGFELFEQFAIKVIDLTRPPVRQWAKEDGVGVLISRNPLPSFSLGEAPEKLKIQPRTGGLRPTNKKVDKFGKTKAQPQPIPTAVQRLVSAGKINQHTRSSSQVRRKMIHSHAVNRGANLMHYNEMDEWWLPLTHRNHSE